MSTNQSILVIEAGRAKPIAGETIERNLQHYLNPSPSGITSDLAASLHSRRMASSSIRGVGERVIPIIDRTDGISAEFPQWRFNIRGSNTESLLRLNVETRGDSPAVLQHVKTIEALIGNVS